MNSTPPSRTPLALLLLVLVLAGGLRIHLAWRAHTPTPDTAVVGQMALDILKGQRPAFFAGQNYMGALESYLLALVFMAVPPGPLTMTFVTIGFALAWIAATFVFFRREYGPWAALAAATVPAFPGWQAIWYTTAPYGGYPQTYFFGMILLHMALPFLERRGFTPTRRHAATLGVIAGLAIWTNLQVVPYLAAAGLAGAWAWQRRPHPLKAWWPYAWIPLAVSLAFLPQFLAESAHVHPPMFVGISLKAMSRSWRAFRHHDLPQALLWAFPPAVLHTMVAILITMLVAGSLCLAWSSRRDKKPPTDASLLVFAMIAVFALTYFPHPMSGFAPRYLIAPITLMLSWILATWGAAGKPWIRRSGYAAALLLAAYNVTGTLHIAQANEAGARATRQEFAGVIHTARDAGWKTILHLGSETEGYDAARLTFMAMGRPLFASGFSDRFLEHQLAWEFSKRGGYLIRQRHLPFIEGSFAAINLDLGRVLLAPPYALIETPEAPRMLETSRLPESIADWPQPIHRHPLFDRSSVTTWPDTVTDGMAKLTLQFDAPIRLAGLRASARQTAELPYRYTVRILKLDGNWVTVQESERRIAGTYLSGTRLYARGHHPWMDLRFEPVVGTALEWIVRSGPENPVPPRLYDLHVLETNSEPWPDWSGIVAELRTIIAANPDGTLIAERGVLRALHVHADSDAWHGRLPLPYNPRFARTQPEVLPLAKGRYILLIEDAYAEAARSVFRKIGAEIAVSTPVPPFCVISVSIGPEASGKAVWRGFQPTETGSTLK